jgi:formiminotetrahydrofolate cyclodeaminase
MKHITRKVAVGVAAVAAVVTMNPWGHANAAPGDGGGRRAAVRQCVVANHRARDSAVTEFRRAVRAARDLEASQRQAAIQAAQDKFQQAAEQARTAFNSCLAAIPDN